MDLLRIEAKEDKWADMVPESAFEGNELVCFLCNPQVLPILKANKLLVDLLVSSGAVTSWLHILISSEPQAAKRSSSRGQSSP